MWAWIVIGAIGGVAFLMLLATCYFRGQSHSLNELTTSSARSRPPRSLAKICNRPSHSPSAHPPRWFQYREHKPTRLVETMCFIIIIIISLTLTLNITALPHLAATRQLRAVTHSWCISSCDPSHIS